MHIGIGGEHVSSFDYLDRHVLSLATEIRASIRFEPSE